MLKAGDHAPDFALPADDGSTVRLRDVGEHVVVYFYPRDDTPGCTVEAKDFSGAMRRFRRAGARVFGISKDGLASHCRFRDKYGLEVPLLSDVDLSVHRAFGAWGEKTMYGKKVEGVIRSTFLIDPSGVVARVWPSVKVAGHAEAVLAALTGDAEPAQKKAAPRRRLAMKKPAAKKPAAKKPAAKKPAAKKPAAKKPAAKKPAAKKRR